MYLSLMDMYVFQILVFNCFYDYFLKKKSCYLIIVSTFVFAYKFIFMYKSFLLCIFLYRYVFLCENISVYKYVFCLYDYVC